VSVIYAGGSFDMFHAGHASLLAECRKLATPGGRVVVALNSDAFIAAYKGRPPVCTYLEREAVLRACRYVDEVILNRFGADSRPTIDEIRPDIIAIGADWKAKDYYRQMGFDRAWLDARSITLTYVAHTYSDALSSSDIKTRLGAR